MTLFITAGQEADAFTADPKVTSVQITVTSPDGSTLAQTSAAPGEAFDLGVIADDQQIGVEVQGTDATGAVVLAGRSLSGLLLSGLRGNPGVFVQRTGQWARPSGATAQAHVGGVAAAIGDRQILVTGGARASNDPATADPTYVDGFDFLTLGAVAGSSFSRVPATLASFGEVLVLLDAAGATWLDYSAQATTVLTAPSGFDFATVAGGASVPTGRDDGRIYVVGATRASALTDGVLAIDADGTLTAYKLDQARRGAAALWISGVGLVVAGGSASGSGVEVLSDTGSDFATGCDPDPVEGAAAVVNGSSGMKLFGGTLGGAPAPTRSLSPGSLSSCALVEKSAETLPVATRGAAAYSLGGDQVLVVAQAASDGETLAYLVNGPGGDAVQALPLKERRRGAVPVATPIAGLALLGGERVSDGKPATSVELYLTR